MINSDHLSPIIEQTILEIVLESNNLKIKFDNCTLSVYDEAQHCCESRYLTCDGDDLSYWSGAKFHGLETREAPNLDSGAECHEQVFIVLRTSKGDQVFAAHNEHNGYYGGFSVSTRLSILV